jgi:CRISPR/Cas system-associated exonuclease Cas4 (RecB family)
MPSTSELLLAADRTRPRAQQAEIGMSELGDCRRRAGYRLAGTAPSNPGGSVQAAMGSAIHDTIVRILEDLGIDGVSHETGVRFAGIPGHYDRVENETIVEVKTTGSRWLEHIKLTGPEISHIWQVSMYAAALITSGRKIRRIRIDYLARDTGEEYQWPSAEGAPFSPMHVRDALGWLQAVKDAPLAMLPRDHEPDSAFCRGCPFLGTCWEGHIPGRDPRSVLYLEDPDAGKWAGELWDLRRQIKTLQGQERRVKGALDAVRPDGGGFVQAGGHTIEFRRTARDAETFAIYFRPAQIETGDGDA